MGDAYYAAETRQSSASTREMLEKRFSEPIRYGDGNSVTVISRQKIYYEYYILPVEWYSGAHIPPFKVYLR